MPDGRTVVISTNKQRPKCRQTRTPRRTQADARPAELRDRQPFDFARPVTIAVDTEYQAHSLDPNRNTSGPRDARHSVLSLEHDPGTPVGARPEADSRLRQNYASFFNRVIVRPPKRIRRDLSPARMVRDLFNISA